MSEKDFKKDQMCHLLARVHIQNFKCKFDSRRPAANNKNMGGVFDSHAVAVNFSEALRGCGGGGGGLQKSRVARTHCNYTEIKVNSLAGFGNQSRGFEGCSLVFDVLDAGQESCVGHNGALGPFGIHHTTGIDPSHF